MTDNTTDKHGHSNRQPSHYTAADGLNTVSAYIYDNWGSLQKVSSVIFY